MSIHRYPSNPVPQDQTRRPVRMTAAQRLLRAIRRWQHSRAVAALQAMPDMYLENIGLARADIPRTVDGIFPRKGEMMPVRLTEPSSAGPRDDFRDAA